MSIGDDAYAIAQLIARYAKGRDTTEAALYREVFAADAQIATGAGHVLSRNLDEILEKVAGDVVRFNPGYGAGESWAVMRHAVTNVLIDIDGDGAASEYYVLTLAYNEAKRRPEVMSTPRNVDRYERRDGRWWIVRSELHFGWEGEELGKALQVGPYTPAQYRR